MNNQEGGTLAAASASIPTTEGLSQLFREHHRRVLCAAYRITGSMADAEDVAQAVFLRLAAPSQQIENPGSYLYRAATNGALDLLRRRKSSPANSLNLAANQPSSGWGSSPEKDATSHQLGNTLRLAISELSPRAAEMFTLRYLEDLSNREIAAMMKTTQAVVAVTLHNARTKLKKRLIQMDGKINETR